MLRGSLRYLLGLSQERLDVVGTAGERQGHGVPRRTAGAGGAWLLWATPPASASTVGTSPRRQGGRDALLDQPRRPLVVGGGERVADRLGDLPVVLVPGGGAQVQLVQRPGLSRPRRPRRKSAKR